MKEEYDYQERSRRQRLAVSLTDFQSEYWLNVRQDGIEIVNRTRLCHFAVHVFEIPLSSVVLRWIRFSTSNGRRGSLPSPRSAFSPPSRAKGEANGKERDKKAVNLPDLHQWTVAGSKSHAE